MEAFVISSYILVVLAGLSVLKKSTQKIQCYSLNYYVCICSGEILRISTKDAKKFSFFL